MFLGAHSGSDIRNTQSSKASHFTIQGLHSNQKQQPQTSNIPTYDINEKSITVPSIKCEEGILLDDQNGSKNQSSSRTENPADSENTKLSKESRPAWYHQPQSAGATTKTPTTPMQYKAKPSTTTHTCSCAIHLPWCYPSLSDSCE